jgi:magnesium-transporting ATPase (P-type)
MHIYVFSSGTLTDNIMKFRRCSIAGKIYGLPIDQNESPDHEYSQLSEVYMYASMFTSITYMCINTYDIWFTNG